ncbi:MAG TPA: DUF1549 and DUF1553 domain-containing protein [Pirellulaceae bacterium]|nr:DUF1549 and DUF1553 domain-containing protein [Pirellulaceae bacterium]
MIRIGSITLSILYAALSLSAMADDANATRRAAMIERIDGLLAERWEAEGIEPATRSDDGEFVRRIHLDLTGVIPRVADVREFLEDERSDKRKRVIEQLLASPRYPTHLANTWRQVMIPGGLDLEQLQNVAGVQNWLRRQFAQNMRYDRIVSDFLVATGGGEAGPALYYTSLELRPEKLAASTARIFLGLQIECAECHPHPFDHWKQEDFWGYAAFFARLQQSENRRGPAEVGLVDLDSGEVTLPDSETVVPPRYPGGNPVSKEAGGTRRVQLAIWMASRDNPYLPKAAVNRMWAHLFGRGLIDPVDDIGGHNPASHPQLFEELTNYFVSTGFDIKELLRTLSNTKAYQLSSRLDREPSPPELFASMAIKTMTAEQLYDSLDRIAGGRPAEIPNFLNIRSNLFDQQRLAFVGKMQMRGSNATEFDAGVLQALTLLNGANINAASQAEQSGVLIALDSPLFSMEERVETLFLGTLSRRPGKDEVSSFVAHVNESSDQREALGDVMWALLNSAEFALNH